MHGGLNGGAGELFVERNKFEEAEQHLLEAVLFSPEEGRRGGSSHDGSRARDELAGDPPSRELPLERSTHRAIHFAARRRFPKPSRTMARRSGGKLPGR